MKKSVSPRTRLEALKMILSLGKVSTQEELVEELEEKGYEVTQSTISRDLRRLGAVKAIDALGRAGYRLNFSSEIPSQMSSRGLRNLLIETKHNGTMIVLHTTPGSASLIARHLDLVKPAGILGTIAGDDTIFVAPAQTKKIEAAVEAILESLT